MLDIFYRCETKRFDLDIDHNVSPAEVKRREVMAAKAAVFEERRANEAKAAVKKKQVSLDDVCAEEEPAQDMIDASVIISRIKSTFANLWCNIRVKSIPIYCQIPTVNIYNLTVHMQWCLAVGCVLKAWYVILYRTFTYPSLAPPV